jgi:hypothetical protein
MIIVKLSVLATRWGEPFMKGNNGLYSNELFTKAFARVAMRKEYHHASPRRKLDILLRECEETLMREMGLVPVSRFDVGEGAYPPFARHRIAAAEVGALMTVQ